MKKSKFSESQIVAILKEGEAEKTLVPDMTNGHQWRPAALPHGSRH
jgi:hypothetical protein